ncbi:MAG: hypothetical protein Q4D14_07510 [Bacteroidales bacterium]|nr:hypothetical protein [Bacteroidales bacterium]
MKFQSLAMASAVAQQKYIDIHKSFFGLMQKVVYTPTNAEVKSDMLYFTSVTATTLRHIINCEDNKVVPYVKQCDSLRFDMNGGDRLDFCYAVDHSFLAVQLFHYNDFLFSPATEVRYFFGQEASAVIGLLNKK